MEAAVLAGRLRHSLGNDGVVVEVSRKDEQSKVEVRHCPGRSHGKTFCDCYATQVSGQTYA